MGGCAHPCPFAPRAQSQNVLMLTLLLFIGTRLVTHALSCVHSAFASCERSFEKKKRKRKFSYFPVLPDLFRSFGVCHTSAALHPPLDATYLQPWGPSNLLLRPSALIPSNYLTHTSDSKNLYTSPSSVPPYAPSWAVCPPLLPAICVFFPSPYFSLSSFRARVTPPPLHSSKVPFALA